MITVLRLNHRHGRDDRISSHVGLAARQFGADRIVFSGDHDESMMASIQDVAERWGGGFSVDYREDWRPVIREFDGTTVHLTMYGLPYREHIDACRGEDLLVVVGSGKVRADTYELVDHNLAVGHQPHSEIAALAVYLHDLFGGDELDRDFPGGEIAVVPQERGKKTVEPGGS